MSEGKILIVEDDPAILIGLREKLSLDGFEVFEAQDGEIARDILSDQLFDVIVLDIMLPRLDGLSLLGWIRKRIGQVPVLIISAKGSEDEKVEGLQAGADDYLAKPFGLKELTARIHALLRRERGGEKPYQFGSIVVDASAKKVFLDEEEVPLSKKELEVLLYLVKNRDRVLSREQILDGVWGYFTSSASRTVDFHILNLRRKLEKDPTTPKHIVTRHGLGFQLIP